MNDNGGGAFPVTEDRTMSFGVLVSILVGLGGPATSIYGMSYLTSDPLMSFGLGLWLYFGVGSRVFDISRRSGLKWSHGDASYDDLSLIERLNVRMVVAQQWPLLLFAVAMLAEKARREGGKHES